MENNFLVVAEFPRFGNLVKGEYVILAKDNNQAVSRVLTRLALSLKIKRSEIKICGIFTPNPKIHYIRL